MDLRSVGAVAPAFVQVITHFLCPILASFPCKFNFLNLHQLFSVGPSAFIITHLCVLIYLQEANYVR